MRYCCRECTTARPRDQVRRKTDISHTSLERACRLVEDQARRIPRELFDPDHCPRLRLAQALALDRHEQLGMKRLAVLGLNLEQELDCCTNPRDEEEQVQRCEPRQPERQHGMRSAEQAGGDADEQQLSLCRHGQPR